MKQDTCYCNSCGQKYGFSNFHGNHSKIQKYGGECLDDVAFCSANDIKVMNDSMRTTCESVGCFQCKDVRLDIEEEVEHVSCAFLFFSTCRSVTLMDNALT